MLDTSGVLFVHSTPSALCPHIEWAATGALGMPVHLEWSPQPALAGSYRAELAWQGPVGTGAKLTSAFMTWNRLRFEVTEDPGPDGEGHRWSYTPTLGVHHAATSAIGEVVVGEEQLRAAMLADARGGTPLRQALDELLGDPWDQELDIFRHAGDDCPVRWLHDAG